MILGHDALRGQNSLPFAHGYAVVFPHCVYSGPLPPDAEREIVFGANDVADLANKVRGALAIWSRATRARPITESLRDAIQESLSPIFKLTPVLWRTVEDQEEKLKRLTTDQEMVLGMLAKQPRAAIEGVAGSGKTILAMAQAQRFARQGKRTLLLCYNRPLADWLGKELPVKFRDLVIVHTFHSLCAGFCKLAQMPFTFSNDDDFWSFTAPDLLEKACQVLGPEHKFEAIVVDEGQDFRDLWWMALEKVQLTTDASFPLYVFYDPKQNIYISQPTLPSNLAGPFVLPTNCRNTRLIARMCGEIIHETIDVHQDAFNGSAPKIIVAVSEADVVRRTREQILDWRACARRGGLPWNKVAVLTPTDPGKEWPTNFGIIPLTDNFDQWRAGKGVLLSTCRRFKGLEADALILAGIPKPDKKKYFTNADYYVAASASKAPSNCHRDGGGTQTISCFSGQWPRGLRLRFLQIHANETIG